MVPLVIRAGCRLILIGAHRALIVDVNVGLAAVRGFASKRQGVKINIIIAFKHPVFIAKGIVSGLLRSGAAKVGVAKSIVIKGLVVVKPSILVKVTLVIRVGTARL